MLTRHEKIFSFTHLPLLVERVIISCIIIISVTQIYVSIIIINYLLTKLLILLGIITSVNNFDNSLAQDLDTASSSETNKDDN